VTLRRWTSHPRSPVFSTPMVLSETEMLTPVLPEPPSISAMTLATSWALLPRRDPRSAHRPWTHRTSLRRTDTAPLRPGRHSAVADRQGPAECSTSRCMLRLHPRCRAKSGFPPGHITVPQWLRANTGTVWGRPGMATLTLFSFGSRPYWAARPRCRQALVMLFPQRSRRAWDADAATLTSATR